MIWSLSSYLSQKESNTLTVVLFLLVSVVFVIMFGVGWFEFGNFESSKINYCKTTLIDAYYFSATTFTTLGYGDFAPNSDEGKIFASIEALLGTTHMVAFFSIVIIRLQQPSKLAARTNDETICPP